MRTLKCDYEATELGEPTPSTRAVPLLNWEKTARITRQRAGICEPPVEMPDSLKKTITASLPQFANNSGPATGNKPFHTGQKIADSDQRRRFHRELLPVPKLFYEKEGLKVIGRGQWRSALCPFHKERHPSFRIHIASGAFKCMACGEKGGDVLDFQMKRYYRSFVAAAKDLGAWEETCR